MRAGHWVVAVGGDSQAHVERARRRRRGARDRGILDAPLERKLRREEAPACVVDRICRHVAQRPERAAHVASHEGARVVRRLVQTIARHQKVLSDVVVPHRRDSDEIVVAQSLVDQVERPAIRFQALATHRHSSAAAQGAPRGRAAVDSLLEEVVPARARSSQRAEDNGTVRLRKQGSLPWQSSSRRRPMRSQGLSSRSRSRRTTRGHLTRSLGARGCVPGCPGARNAAHRLPPESPRHLRDC